MASTGTSGIERDLTRQQAVSASAASECFDNESESCLEIQEEELSVESCDDCNKGTSYEEAFQGPHKWRRQLRHVPSKRSKKNQATEEPSSQTENTYHRNFDNDPENQDIQVYDTGQSPYLQTVVHGPSQGVQCHPDHDPAANIPPWKRELLEKTSHKKSNSTSGGQTSQIPVTIRRRGSLHGQSESAFTRQVVNSNAGNMAARKKLSPSNSFRQAISNSSAFPGRRNISQQNALLDVPANDDLTKKRIERVQRARLYLLQQTGPNSFLIGGDSPDHKYRVIIGPQTCSCGRGPHCVHVLFVMLRVFQVGEAEPCLWSRTLKNYEVENLFRIYHDKRSSRITNRRPSQRRKEQIQDQSSGDVEEDRTTDTLNNNRLPSESDAGSVREEEDICPICLLEMLEGESLIKCESGCHNRLHHHCIAIWFEECRRQNDPLNCPLCRAQWKTATVEIKCMQNESETQNMSPGARSSSPQQTGTRDDIARLPYAEPIPLEMEQIAAPWIEALGSDLVCCLLSRNWSIREIGLKHLSKDVMATLLKGAGEGRSGVIVSPVRRAATHNMLQTACNILAYMCADPVYRVFVASLRSLRTILAYTPCRDAEQRSRLQTILKPVVEAIILKSTDGNRRTSQLSLSTLVELVKGQEGELAVGREIFSPGNEGLDGLNYILKCVVQDYDPEAAPWQWLLGRLYVLDRLLEEFPTEFLPRPENLDAMGAGAAADVDEEVESSGAAAGHQTKQEEEFNECGASNYTRLMSVAHFSVKAVCSTHMRIARMSRRVFLLSAKLGAHVQSVIAQLKDLLLQIDSTSVASLRRKLDRIVEDFQLSERIVHELMHGSGRRGKFESPSQTPMDSPSSSPRSSSPVTVLLNEAHETGTFSPEKLTPTNPNSQNKRKLKRFIPRRSSRETNRSENCPENSRDGHNVHLDVNKKAGSEASGIMCMRFGSASPPNRRRSNLPLRRKTIEGEKVVKRSASSATVTIRRRTHDGCVISSNESLPTPTSSKIIPRKVMTSTPTQTVGYLVPLISITDTSVPEARLFQPEDLSDLTETSAEALRDGQISHSAPSLFEMLKASSSNHPVDHLSFCITEEEPQLCPSSASSAIQPVNSSSLYCCQCHCHDSQGSDETVTSPASGTDGVTSTPDRAGAGHYHTAEHETMSSDDFLDFSQEATSSPNEKPVSFKSEVAESPKSSPSHSVHSGPDSKKDDCGGTCKEEVEKEEAEALARALEVSDRLDPLPVVPGLTPSIREEVITIRIQPDEDFDDGDSVCKQPTMYLEKLHWVKGPLLGTGAYSSCYQARDVRTGVIMAVKQISFCRNSAQEQEKVIEAISEEIHMMARLSHPNIVRILGATKQGCHFNMFVEWMPGGSVAYLLGEYGPFTENVLVNYTRQLLRGLAYLHDNHTLHRDLKGANLLIDSSGQTLRIGDFGASARLASQATGAGEFQGQLLGTIAFMAPEVLRGENYGRSCDVWSVGCVMIEMATTKPPWNATAVSNHLALIFKIASAVDSPPIPENLSPPVRDLMLRCLEQSSEDRPSAKDLLLHPLFTRCFISPPRSTAV